MGRSAHTGNIGCRKIPADTLGNLVVEAVAWRHAERDDLSGHAHGPTA